MTASRRIERLNSLLKEVLSDVIRRHVKDPRLAAFASISRVDISKDLHHAKVFVSILGDDAQREQTLKALTSAAGFIGVNAAKQITIRYFPTLTFKLDTSVDEQMKIDALIQKIHEDDNA